MQSIDALIRVLPWICQRLAVERLDKRSDFDTLEQARPLGKEQAYGELDGRHMIDEIERGDLVEQFAVPSQCLPRVKRHERRNERQIGVPAQLHSGKEVGSRVSLVKDGEHAVVNRLDGARHE